MPVERSVLSPFQWEILEAFFARAQGFYLTGGAALAGFHLGHRSTQDLDLFTSENILEDGAAALRESARELGATVESLRTSPSFRRFLLRRKDEGVAVDLVHDSTPQGALEKLCFGVIRVDPPGEILANKLCTLISRAEIRDLVDVFELERAGHPVERALPLATRKDGGLTPAQLAWVLAQVKISDRASVPGRASPAEIRDYLERLIERLTNLARPR